jgi:hypothetical protein
MLACPPRSYDNGAGLRLYDESKERPMLTDLPRRLGLQETAGLTEARRRLVTAITQGSTTECRTAWAAYQAEVECQVDAVPAGAGARLQLAVIIDKALVWLAADELLAALRELIDAWTYADNLQDQAVVAEVQMAVLAHRGTAEHLWATQQYDRALSHYETTEQEPSLTPRERGLLNLRLAELYTELRRQPPHPDDFELPPQPLALLAMESLQTALLNLDGLPEQAKALRLLDELEAEGAAG